MSMSEEEQKAVFMSLADISIRERGFAGAVEFAALIEIREVRDFSAYVKAVQRRGGKALEMTSEVIAAYNEMLWGASLLAAVLSKKPQDAGANAEGSEAVN